MVLTSSQLVANLLRGSWRRRQQVREEVMRKLTTSRGSYEELVPVEFGLYASRFYSAQRLDWSVCQTKPAPSRFSNAL